MSQGSSWLRIDRASDLQAHQDAWRRARRTQRLDPYLDPLWYATWWDSFGGEEAEAELWLLSLQGPSSAPEARGYVPLMRQDSTLSFLGNVYSHRQGIAASGHWAHVMESLLRFLESKREWDHVRLAHLPADGPEATQLRLLLQGHSQWREEAGETELWAIPKAHDGESLAQWQAHLHSQGRESRRKRRRIHRRADELAAATAPLTLQRYTSVDDASAFARHYMQILSGSWKRPESSRSFFRQLCQQTAEQGWFHSYVLHHGERPIACQLGFLCDGTYHCYKTAYLQQYATCSPGILVMDMAFEALFDDGLAQRIDLLTGDTPYKQLWCNQKRPQVSFCLGTPSEPPDPPGKPDAPALCAMSWIPERHASQPLAAGRLADVADSSPVALALAMGAPNLQQVTERLEDPQWRGLVWYDDDGQLRDVAWLEYADVPRLHLPPPFVRAQRPPRLALIAALLENTNAPRVEAHVPPAHRPTLLALGFVEE